MSVSVCEKLAHYVFPGWPFWSDMENRSHFISPKTWVLETVRKIALPCCSQLTTDNKFQFSCRQNRANLEIHSKSKYKKLAALANRLTMKKEHFSLSVSSTTPFFLNLPLLKKLIAWNNSYFLSCLPQGL